MRVRVTAAVVVLTLCAASAAAADPAAAPAGAIHVLTSAHLVSDGGTDLRLPPSYILDEPTWTRLDAEVRRLQDVETRLTAENTTLRASVGGWHPGWKLITSTLAVGLAVGFYVGRR